MLTILRLLHVLQKTLVVLALKVTNTGSDYDSATITIESPSLPGGSNATGSVAVSGGLIYDSTITLAGRGYTEPPSVVIRGTGLLIITIGAEPKTEIYITEPAVRMEFAEDETGSLPSITPTNFMFDYPVFLQNNTEYALVVETDSKDYSIWVSKLGETKLQLIQQLLQIHLWVLFISLKYWSWVKILFEDIKFTLPTTEQSLILLRLQRSI